MYRDFDDWDSPLFPAHRRSEKFLFRAALAFMWLSGFFVGMYVCAVFMG